MGTTTTAVADAVTRLYARPTTCKGEKRRICCVARVFYRSCGYERRREKRRRELYAREKGEREM